MYSKIPEPSSFEITLMVGSVHRVSGLKANMRFGYMEKRTYESVGINYQCRSLVNGVWNEWV